MRELFIAWTFGLVLMLGGGFFAYRPIKEVLEHVKKHKNDHAHNTPHWIWYWDLFSILGEVLFGTLGKPSLITSIIFSFLGTLVFVSSSIKIVASLLRLYLL